MSGLDQCGTWGGGKKRLESAYILKIQPSEITDVLERKEVSDCMVFILNTWKDEAAIKCNWEGHKVSKFEGEDQKMF